MEESNSILFLYNQKSIIYDGQEAHSCDFKESKNSFTSAIVPLKYLSTFSYKIAKTTSDDEIAMQTEIKMYSEGGLDPEKEYIVDYIKYEIENDCLIEAFALSKEYFEESLGEYSSKVAAIDMVFPRFLAYQTLYDEKFSKSSNDLILYISEEESFAALYQKGRYIGYRTLSSLNEMSKNIGIEVVKLKEYLQTKGLVQANYDLEEMHILDSIQRVLFKDMEKIMYSMNQKRSLFGFDGIDRVIVDFYEKNILGIEQFFVPYGYESIEIDRLSFEENEKYGNISIYLDYIYKLKNTASEDENSYQRLNFSFLERKKSLIKYLVLKYAVLFGLSLLISLAVYIYFEMILSHQQDQIKQKQLLLKKERVIYSKFAKKLKSLKKKYAKLEKQKNKIGDTTFIYENTLSTIPMIQDAKYKRQKFMNDVLIALQKYNLNTESIKQYDDKSMDILLISNTNNRDHITKFIDALIAKHYHSVSTKKIYLDKNIYKSMVRIEL